MHPYEYIISLLMVLMECRNSNRNSRNLGSHLLGFCEDHTKEPFCYDLTPCSRSNRNKMDLPPILLGFTIGSWTFVLFVTVRTPILNPNPNPSLNPVEMSMKL